MEPDFERSGREVLDAGEPDPTEAVHEASFLAPPSWCGGWFDWMCCYGCRGHPEYDLVADKKFARVTPDEVEFNVPVVIDGENADCDICGYHLQCAKKHVEQEVRKIPHTSVHEFGDIDKSCVYNTNCAGFCPPGCCGCCGPAVIFSQKSSACGGFGEQVEDIRAAPASLHGAKVCGACGQPCYVCCCATTVLHRIDDGELFIDRYEHAVSNAQAASSTTADNRPPQKVVFANIDATGFCGLPPPNPGRERVESELTAKAKTEHSAAADEPEPDPLPPEDAPEPAPEQTGRGAAPSGREPEPAPAGPSGREPEPGP